MVVSQKCIQSRMERGKKHVRSGGTEGGMLTSRSDMAVYLELTAFVITLLRISARLVLSISCPGVGGAQEALLFPLSGVAVSKVSVLLSIRSQPRFCSNSN